MSLDKVGLLFPGQGAQYVGMGQDLAEQFESADAVFTKASDICGFDIKEICFRGPDEKLQQTRYAQSAIYAVSMAALSVLKPLLADKGLVPAAAAGLSLGEASALTSAGVFTLDDGISFVKNRGLFMDEASIENPGTMAAVMGLDLDKVEQICAANGIEVANLNAPGQIVVAGNVDGVKNACEELKEAGARRCMVLDVSGAFHSKCMDPACERIAGELQNISLQTPEFSVYSNLTARYHCEEGEIKKNLISQMNSRTLWEESMRQMCDSGIRLFFEVGPGRVLKGLMKKINPDVEVVSFGTAADVREFQSKEYHVA